MRKGLASKDELKNLPLETIYQKVVQYSADAILTIDNHNRIVTWNIGCELLFGYRANEVVGQDMALLIPKQMRDVRELEMIEKMTAHDGYLRNYETERVARGGRTISINQSQTPLYDNHGNKIGSALVIKDISGRKGLEKSLRKKIEQMGSLNEVQSLLHRDLGLQRTLQTILVGVTSEHGLRFNRAFLLLVDQETNLLKGEIAIGPSSYDEAHRIWTELRSRDASLADTIKSLESQSGPRDTAVRQIVSDLEIPLSQTDNILVQALLSRKPVNVRSKRDCPDKSLLKILQSETFVVVPLIMRDKYIGVLVADNLITDSPITQDDIDVLQIFANHAAIAINDSWLLEELKKSVEALRQVNLDLKINQEKLMAAEKLSTIGEMAAKVAHEIRNPLATIGGFARTIQKDITIRCQVKEAHAACRICDREKNDYLEIIVEEVTRLEEILTKLLDYARPIAPVYEKTDFGPILENVITLLEPELEQHKINVTKKFPPEEVQLSTDRKLILQILVNLFKNAIQAMQEQGGGQIEVGYRKQDDKLRISIKDSGMGISAENQQRIFRPFFTTRAGGSGLGLAIISQYLNRLGGKIYLNSQVGEGSEFTIQLPIQPREEKK